MPTIPLPFVVALLLIVLLARVVVQGETALRPAIVFIGACIFLVITVGLRWTVDLQIVRFLQPVVAALLPPIAWFCFSDLGQPSSARRWPHFLPVVVILLLSATWQRWHTPIDLLLLVLYFAYGLLLLRRAHAGPDSFERSRLGDAFGVQRAALLSGWLLLFSGFVDLVIAGDFYFFPGSHAVSIIGIANIVTLPLLAYAIAVLGRSLPEAGSSDEPSEDRRDGQLARTAMTPPAQDDEQIMVAVETAMRDKQLFRDPDLTLNRLARKVGLPSRQISATINRTLGRNVSQLVNEYRIKEAQRLLMQTDLPITSVMLECGFYTKSNFNREFARVAGMTPSDYRRSAAQ